MKKNIFLLITALCIFIMVLSSLSISYSSLVTSSEEEYINKNFITSAKKCYLDKVCKKGKITLKTLDDNGYLTNEMKEKLEFYSYDSYIMYPSNKITLIKE